MPDSSIQDGYYPSRALISRSAFLHNLQRARDLAGDTEILAIVKADAYGHGKEEISRWALDAGVNWLGVAQLGEAIQLRKTLQQRGRMLALIAEPGSPFAEALTLGIDLSVGAQWTLDEIIAAAEKLNIAARVHIEVDTGMARSGFLLEEFRQVVPKLVEYRRRGLLEMVGLWSHLARADELSSPTTDQQVAIFEEARQVLESAGLEVQFCHLAASAGLLWHPETRYSMVRLGAMLYGLSPNPELATAEELDLRPVMQLEADIVSTRDVPAGTGISYGHTVTLEKATHLGTVPLGYADGVPRHASNSASVVINGQDCPILGRICMDQFVVDAPGVQPGDIAVLFGDSAKGYATADDWAADSGTIGYEIICRLGARIPRQYVE
ncbi:alanine racemase [uncultured Arcanobacterium sp.]|uniref:alanine racemase n=1 Tax=uncultured Arcanobacterium sp. TaxID=487520 RepID=UPI0026185EF4|nr:alanine racemase [uncultured Arcanobacterium sp.]